MNFPLLPVRTCFHVAFSETSVSSREKKKHIYLFICDLSCANGWNNHDVSFFFCFCFFVFSVFFNSFSRLLVDFSFVYFKKHRRIHNTSFHLLFSPYYLGFNRDSLYTNASANIIIIFALSSSSSTTAPNGIICWCNEAVQFHSFVFVFSLSHWIFK